MIADKPPLVTEPDWLTWTRDMQAIAQNGLAFTRDAYDRERFEALRALASRIMATHSGDPAAKIDALFAQETGYATPKIDVRGAVFDDRGRILMVREIADHGLWTLPGGSADINLTTAENVAKEIAEESGYIARPRKLAAVYDRSNQGHPAGLFSCCKIFYICDLLGGAAKASLETSAVAWFAEEAVPMDGLSLGRVLPAQVEQMFAHHRDAGLPTDFD